MYNGTLALQGVAPLPSKTSWRIKKRWCTECDFCGRRQCFKFSSMFWHRWSGDM